MRIRKADREALEKVLSREGDLDDVVEEAFATVSEQVLARDWYVAAVHDGMNTYLYGPFESESVATRSLKGLVSPGPDPMQFQIRKMYKVEENVT